MSSRYYCKTCMVYIIIQFTYNWKVWKTTNNLYFCLCVIIVINIICVKISNGCTYYRSWSLNCQCINQLIDLNIIILLHSLHTLHFIHRMPISLNNLNLTFLKTVIQWMTIKWNRDRWDSHGVWKRRLQETQMRLWLK